MSLDFYLEAPRITEVYGGNYTHNVSPMWRKAGCYRALYESHGARGHAVVADLKAGIAAMEADPEGFKALNPENGWGDYDTALEFLREVLKACEEHPDAAIRISR